MPVKALALALTTLLRAASAATEYYVSYSGWEVGKLMDVQFQWDNTPNGSTCQTQCSQYAEDNNYVNHFLCSYEDGKKPHTCTISPDNNVKDKTDGVNNWKKSKGTPHGYTPSPTPANLLTPAVGTDILDVANNEESAINSAVNTVLEETLDPITGAYIQDYISYSGWEVGKLEDVQFQWDNTPNKSTCQTQCSQYAENNTYVNHFLCSYEDGKKPHTCTISPDNNVKDKTDGVNNWKKSKGTPETSGETLPLYADSGKEIIEGGLMKVVYSYEVIKCYPENGWDGSLTIGPYTSITSDSFISPETFVGSVGVVGDVSMSKLVCTATVSSDVYQQFFGWQWLASGNGNAKVTASANGDATVTMDSTECTASNTAEGIFLSPETCDIELNALTVNNCDCSLIISVYVGALGFNINVGEMACNLLKQDAWNIASSLADAGANAASNALEDEFKNIYTDCLPIAPAPNEPKKKKKQQKKKKKKAKAKGKKDTKSSKIENGNNHNLFD